MSFPLGKIADRIFVWVASLSAVAAVLGSLGCAAAPASMPMARADPAELAFAQRAGAEFSMLIQQQPAIAGARGPIAIELADLENRANRPDADQLARSLWLAVADELPAYRPWVGDRPPANVPAELVLDTPGRPVRDERVFVLAGVLDELDRPGTIDDILYFDLRLTNAATRVTLVSAQYDSRQYR